MAKQPKLDTHLVSLTAPASFAAEQYQGLRLTIERLARSRDMKVIAISSPAAGDGKTVTAINLAGALARGGDERVLLIDADLRRPSVARQLAIDRCADGAGRRADRSRTSAVADVVQPLEGSISTSFPRARRARGVSQILRSPRLDAFLQEARQRYGYIVLDTPPLLPVFDSALLAKSVDGVLMVVSANQTPRKLLGEALNMLEPVEGARHRLQPRRASALRLLQLVLPRVLPRRVAGCQRSVTRPLTKRPISMVPRLSTTVDLAPLLLVGWQVVLPVTELPYLSSLILLVAAVAVARLVAREIRPKAPRILILGSGPMAWKLIEEIEKPSSPRYAVAGIVSDEQPDAASPDAARWLGHVRPARRHRPARAAVPHRRRRRRPPRPAADAVAARVARARHRRRGCDRFLRAADRQDCHRGAAAERPHHVEGFPQPWRRRNRGAHCQHGRRGDRPGARRAAPRRARHRHQAGFARSGPVRSAACRPRWAALRPDQVPDDAPGDRGARRSGSLDNLDRITRDRPVAAALPPRRAAAAGECPARRDEPDRAASAPDVQPRRVRGSRSPTTACATACARA